MGWRAVCAWCLCAVGLMLGAAVGAQPSGDASATDPGYTLTRGIAYRDPAETDDYGRERCRLDAYVPVGRGRFDTIVWFHGGGLTGGDRFIPGPFRRKGVAVIAAGYRLSPRAKSPAYVEDAAAAVAWTFRHIEAMGGSPDRIFVCGHSAGGYLTAMVGLDRRWLAAYGVDANRIAGLAPLSPQVITHFTIRAERGIPDKQPVIDDMAPLYHVRKDAPPMLVVTGDREKEMLGRYEENAYFRRMLALVGHPDVVLKELRGRDHGGMAEPAMPLVLRFMARHPAVRGDRSAR